MAPAEAQALAADLLTLPWDGELIARAALEVTMALLAASPRVSWAGADRSVPPCPRASVPPVGGGGSGEPGLWWADAAGLGSEAKLARRLARLARDLGFGPTRVGVADSAIAAYAATYGGGHRGTEARGHGDAAAAAAGERRVRRHAEASTNGAQPGAPPGLREQQAAACPPRPRDAAAARIVPPGGDAAFLAPFPLALLGPGEDLAETCHALGLRTVGQIAALDADEVETRFGPEGLALHRLARGIDTRGPSAPRDDSLPLVSCDIGSPVATAEPLLFVLKGALASLGLALRVKGLAAREIALTLTLDDGSTAEKAVRPARPTSHEGALFDHCRAAFDGWALPEPVTALAVRAAVTVAASGEQGDLLAPRWADPAALEAAFDRIRGREGGDAVAMPVQRDGHLPRDAGAWRTDGRTVGPSDRRTVGPSDRRTAGPSDDRTIGRSGRQTEAAAGERQARWRAEASTHGAQPGAPPGLREREAAAHADSESLRACVGAPRALTLDPPSNPPAAAALRLLPVPVAVRVRLGRSGLEAFRHGETWHDVTEWSGPERLMPPWWAPQAAPGDGLPPTVGTAGVPAASVAGPRDYYSARAAEGALWLLFRDAGSRRWFLEGWWD